MREDSGDGQGARADLEVEGNGKEPENWPYMGEPPIYPPLSPWTRFQGGAFYIMLINLFSILWTLLCGVGIFYGMRNVAIVKGLTFWEALLLRWDTGLWLWTQVWLYPILLGQLAGLFIRLYHKKKGRPLLKASLIPGPRR